MTWGCSHPRVPEDAEKAFCRTCTNVKNILRKLDRERSGLLTLGERISRGLA
jgi:hypothetical protein